MAHYAKVNNQIVEQIIVADSDFFHSFVDTSPGEWIKTSYNTQGGVHTKGGTPLRKNYAGIGFIYDKGRDAFYAPQPFNSWTLDSDTCQWQSPVSYPTDDKPYTWNEESQSWDSDSL